MVNFNSQARFHAGRPRIHGHGVEGIAAGHNGAAALGNRLRQRAKDGHPEWPPGQ